MRRLIRGAVFAVALGAVGVVASARDAGAQGQSRYPQNSTVYRARMENMVKVLRAQCQKACPPTARERIMAALAKVESRVVDVCADGWVTDAENDYVMSVLPESGPPPPPRPH